MNRPQRTLLSALVGALLTGTAFGGGWTLYDEQESTMVAVLNSCDAKGVCTTPLNLNGDVNPANAQPRVDLVIANDFGPTRIYLGTGEDGRGFTTWYPILDSNYAFRSTGLRFADLDNDGDLDMVQTNRGNGNYIYQFKNTSPPFYCAASECVDSADVRLGGVGAADNSQGLAVGDLNLDCKIDVLVVNGVGAGDQSNKAYLNQTAGIAPPGANGACAAAAPNTNPLVFGAAIVLPAAGTADADSRKVELADVDADGDLDAIVANADANDNWLYINQTRPAPAPAALFAAPVPLTAAATDDSELTFGVAVGDIDKDGDPDIAVANSNAANRIYFNAGGAATPPTRFATTATFGAGTASGTDIKLGDVNRDSFLDAVVTNDPSPNRVYLLQGAAGALADYEIPNPGGVPGQQPFNLVSSRALDLARLDNDEWLDLVVANTNNQYNLRFLNNGDCQPATAPTPCDPFANKAPAITGPAGPPLSGNAGAPLVIPVSAVAATDADNLNADLRLAIDPGASYTVTTVSGPTPTITPAADFSGPLTVNVRVTDLTALSAPAALTVTVMPAGTPVANAPTFTSTAITAATQGAPYSYAVTTADPDAGQARTITAPTKPAWLNLTDNGDGSATLAGTPGAADVGPHNVTLEVRDAANLTATQAFTVTVAAAPAGGGGPSPSPAPQPQPSGDSGGGGGSTGLLEVLALLAALGAALRRRLAARQ
jgi:hypothetical protein